MSHMSRQIQGPTLNVYARLRRYATRSPLRWGWTVTDGALCDALAEHFEKKPTWSRYYWHCGEAVSRGGMWARPNGPNDGEGQHRRAFVSDAQASDAIETAFLASEGEAITTERSRHGTIATARGIHRAEAYRRFHVNGFRAVAEAVACAVGIWMVVKATDNGNEGKETR